MSLYEPGSLLQSLRAGASRGRRETDQSCAQEQNQHSARAERSLVQRSTCSSLDHAAASEQFRPRSRRDVSAAPMNDDEHRSRCLVMVVALSARKGFETSSHPDIVAAAATLQKPTQPCHCKLMGLGSTRSKKAIGAGQVGLCQGTCVQRRLAPSVELSARRSEVPAMPEMLVAPAEQVSLLLYFPSSGASRIRTCGCDQALSHGGIGEPGRRECDRIV